MINKILKFRNTEIGFKIGRNITILLEKIKLYKEYNDKKINKKIKELMKQLPRGIDIGITNKCNANCIMCPHNRVKNFGTMDFKLYKKIIDNCKDIGINYITLSFFGEAMLDKGLIKKIKYAKQKDMIVTFYTNGSLMNEKICKSLLNSNLDEVTISFDGTTKEVYEKIRRNLKFEIVKNNINNLVELKKKLNSKTKIKLVFLELDENYNQIKDFYKEWKNKVDLIAVINQRNWGGTLNKDSKNSLNYKGLIRTPCNLVYTKLVVDWDGEVVICVDDWSHKVILGNLNNQRIEEVWFGKKYNLVKEAHLKREFNKISLCSKCNKKTLWLN